MIRLTGRDLLGVFPFALVAVAFVIVEWPVQSANFEEAGWFLRHRLHFFLAMNGLVIAGFCYGWIKYFPRWSYPYVFYSTLFSFYWMNVTTPGLTFFGWGMGRNVWGGIAWIPFLVAASIAHWKVGTLKPWGFFFKRFKFDWIRYSFGLYTCVLFLVSIASDETDRTVTLPYGIAAMLIINIGALGYMKA